MTFLRTGRLAAAAVATAVLLAAPAWAVPVKSRLTTIELKWCTQTKKHKDGGAWRCAGLPGFPVYLAEGDLRHMLSFGPGPEKRRAAQQTLAPFNSIFDSRARATVEWRFERKGGRDVPYATIVRYHTARDGERGEVLVVSRIGGTETCHAAYIDALANAEAMALARSFADVEARKLDCAGEPMVIGMTGKSPM